MQDCCQRWVPMNTAGRFMMGKQARSNKQPGDLQVNVPSTISVVRTTQGRKTSVADPIVKKAWFTADSKRSLMTIEALLGYTSNLNIMSPGTVQLELNLRLNDIKPDNLVYLNQIISAVQNVDIGIEKTLPKISICIPYYMASETLVKAFNELDIYNPRIEFYILVQRPHMISFFHSSSAVSLGKLLYKHHIRFHVFLLLDLSMESLRSLKDGRVEQLLDWLKETLLGLCPPVVEVGLFPPRRSASAFAEPLLTLIGKYPELLETSGSVYCGLLSLLNRANEIYALTEKQALFSTAMLSSCGATISSSYLRSSSLAQIQVCPYKITNFKSRSLLMKEKCPDCPWLDYCSGCLAAFSQEGKCCLQPYYTIVCTALRKRTHRSSRHIDKEVQMLILEHDWDYIYDPFDVP